MLIYMESCMRTCMRGCIIRHFPHTSTVLNRAPRLARSAPLSHAPFDGGGPALQTSAAPSSSACTWRRGAWARVTTDQLRHLALHTC